jgi:hypothetical protein
MFEFPASHQASKRGFARLGQWRRALNPWVQFLAALAALLAMAITIIVAVVIHVAEQEKHALAILEPQESSVSGYFDVDRLFPSSDQVSNYNYWQFSHTQTRYIRWVEVGTPASFGLFFTVANTSDTERAAISAVSLRLEETKPPPARLRIGCRPAKECLGGRGGDGWDNIVSFDVQVDSRLLGVDQPIPSVSRAESLLTVGPSNLQAFAGTVRFSSAGLHELRIVVDYQTSAGRSDRIVSDPIEFLVMPSTDEVEGVVPDICLLMQCPSTQSLEQP